MRLVITLICLLCFSQVLLATDCPFCQKEIEKQEMVETDLLRIILDHAPRVRGHLLIIPKRHVVKAHELSKEEGNEIAFLIPKIVQVFEKSLNTDQYIIFEKTGRNAFQAVPHVHFHLFPIQSQKWQDIFDVEPSLLSAEEIKNEINFFKLYFANELENN